MELSRLIRPVLLMALAGAILWLALHREILQSAELEQELGPVPTVTLVELGRQAGARMPMTFSRRSLE